MLLDGIWKYKTIKGFKNWDLKEHADKPDEPLNREPIDIVATVFYYYNIYYNILTLGKQYPTENRPAEKRLLFFSQ